MGLKKLSIEFVTKKKLLNVIYVGFIGLLLLIPAQAKAGWITVAQWEFDSGAFTDDSSGNGYGLTNVHAVQGTTGSPDGSSGYAVFNRGDADGSDMLYSTAALPLSDYDKVKVTWWQKIENTEASILWETGNPSNREGGINCIVNSTTPGDGSNQYHILRSGVGPGLVRDTYHHTTSTTTWEKFTVIFDPDSAVLASQIVVYDENGTIVDSSSITSDVVLPFLDFNMYLGARGDSATPPYNGVTGCLDNVIIEGYTVPEPATIGLLLAGGLGLYARRKYSK